MKEQLRFRAVVDNPKSSMSSCDNCTATHTLTNQGTNATSIAGVIISQKGLDKVFQMGGSQLPLSPFENTIITYYGAQSQNKIRRR